MEVTVTCSTHSITWYFTSSTSVMFFSMELLRQRLQTRHLLFLPLWGGGCSPWCAWWCTRPWSSCHYCIRALDDGGTNAYKRTKLPALTHNFKYKLSMYQVTTKTSLYASTKSPSLTSLYGNEDNHQYWIKHNAIFILANRISHFHIPNKQVQYASTHVPKKMFILA